ncbi:NAD(P)H-binding protein [Mucilaginibacter aquatilis]|uniref:NAD(P)H-binding protein n=1 Tax=Mucilaginibacter aquatilis TaxID=1517760 RepID=A0A6I4I6Q0_9SPHI|nr:NAD(P)H-binding protein [Mucilaginibacter aquatilis]MVN90547.1 NAD(P)H-binding protein [Mucilaginibacter aquatilis]
MANKAVLAGASGLTGEYLLKTILNQPHYDEVMVIVRKQLPIEHKKLVQLIIDFDKLDEVAKSINGNVFFCCLGTTKAKTPDIKQYRKIEHYYPVKLAQIASENGFKQFHYMSSVGANKNASSAYLKFKGQTENDIQKLAFESIHIYRPSVLTGKRKEFRLLEKVAGLAMRLINPLLGGSLQKYKSISAVAVAIAMYKQSLKTDEGTFIYPSHHIKQLA